MRGGFQQLLSYIHREGIISAIFRANQAVKNELLLYANKSKYKKSIANSDKILFINPISTKFHVSAYEIEEITGSISRKGILGGDWDNHKRKFDDYYVLESFFEHFSGEKRWEDTRYYRHRMIKTKNKSNVLNTLKKYDKIYRDIKLNGYKTQQELYPNDPDKRQEVQIHIGRDGELIHASGRHRHSIAKVLNLEEIPVGVRFRHKNWQKLRHEIATANSYHDLSEQARVHLTHPDMKDVLKISNI